jgi:hypothetical protein
MLLSHVCVVVSVVQAGAVARSSSAQGTNGRMHRMYNVENEYYDQHDSDDDGTYETDTDDSDDDAYETSEQVTISIFQSVCFTVLLNGCLSIALLLLRCALHCVSCTTTYH